MPETKDKSFLSDVKGEFEGFFREGFKSAWSEIVEPALKASYKNGVEAGKKGRDEKGSRAENDKPVRSWGRRS